MVTGPATRGGDSPTDPRVLARQTRELAAFAERRGLDDELAAVREALSAISRRQHELEPEAVGP